MTDKEQIDRLLALAEVQTADIHSLLSVVTQLAEIVRRDHADTPDVGALHLRFRKHLLQAQLEAIEQIDPARAARLQRLIDDAATIYPYDYE